ncbi:MAG: hypothetical protein IT577_21105, partial [Verrucomicrobiae bacterium]|nr:hypothetical protein [Verrucomicrobiae bacterium]
AELLTVLGIIGVLVTLSVPALRGVSEGTGMMQALTRIGGTLDLARNYAVANNTHTWVAFTENAEAGDSLIRLVAFASRTGTNLDSEEGGALVEFPTDNVELISPIETLRQVRLTGAIPDNNGLKSSEALASAGEITEFPSSSVGLQIKVQERTFTRSIHFKPSGEAAIENVLPETIQIVVIPEKVVGQPVNEKDERQASVIRVSGLTGQAVVYQPR